MPLYCVRKKNEADIKANALCLKSKFIHHLSLSFAQHTIYKDTYERQKIKIKTVKTQGKRTRT